MAGRRVRRAVLGAVTACAAVAGVQAMPALAAPGGTGHTVTMTQTQHGTWTETGDTDFCTGETISPTFTGNQVSHVTYFPAGDEVWGTFTEEGRVTFLQPSSGLTFSGRVTIWGNFNVNRQNSNNTFTASFKATAVDSAGATHVEVGHEVMHIAFHALDPIDPVVTFDRLSVTCS